MKKMNFTKLGCALAFTLIATGAYAEETIVGGLDVTANETIARRTVAIVMDVMEDGKEGTAICTGSIIDSTHILSAGHCADGMKSGFIVFATKNIFKVFEKPSPTQAMRLQSTGMSGTVSKLGKITGAKIIPGYSKEAASANNGTGEFPDYSIMTFEGGLPDGYEPAHFLSVKDLTAQMVPGSSVTLAGYGRTSAPGMAALRVDLLSAKRLATDPNGGSGSLRKVQVTFDHFTPKGIDMWVKSPNGGHIACSGDSGGPALLVKTGDSYTIGVDSRGDCRDVAIYSVITQELVRRFLTYL